MKLLPGWPVDERFWENSRRILTSRRAEMETPIYLAFLRAFAFAAGVGKEVTMVAIRFMATGVVEVELVQRVTMPYVPRPSSRMGV